ncbi:hypothetical protein OG921_02490 [Aldersonia sp. NBC_00410]|uniref:hypothetical protein n=1 Tax=Aldersonia sp. NBC_00410 TaxID=2975954 RepID=UPI002258B329|nr:hypothetical protein [Aldersonia sp. NBC_00410]MCX5042063.1 hypothetical protein [Aldersonia sp. NBC_00410]
MKIRKAITVAALTVATIGSAVGTVNAAPVASTTAPSTQIAPRINYTAHNNGTAAVITTDAGSLTVANGQFQIKAADGTIVGGVPLELRVDDISMPVDAKVAGNTATLTPDPTRAVYKPVGLPFQESAPWKTPYEREQAAWARLTTTITTGAAVGAVVGAVGAAAVGCAAGVALGAGVGAFAFLVGSVPGAVIGCMVGAATFLPFGTLGGSLLVSGPVVIGAAIQYLSTINAPFTPAVPAPTAK